MKKTLLTISFTSLFLSLGLIGIPEAFDFTFITDNILSALGSFLMIFFFTVLFLHFFFISKKKIFKILNMILFIFLIFTSSLSVVAVWDVFQDRSVYHNKDFEAITGIAENENFETGRHIQNPHLIKFEIDGTTLQAIELWIEKQEYQNQYQGQKVEVLYLPNSKIAVELNVLKNK